MYISPIYVYAEMILPKVGVKSSSRSTNFRENVAIQTKSRNTNFRANFVIQANPKAPIFGQISRFRQIQKHQFSEKFRGSGKIPKYQFAGKFLNSQISEKIRGFVRISGKFRIFNLIVGCIRSIPAAIIGFPIGTTTFSSAGIPLLCNNIYIDFIIKIH